MHPVGTAAKTAALMKHLLCALMWPDAAASSVPSGPRSAPEQGQNGCSEVCRAAAEIRKGDSGPQEAVSHGGKCAGFDGHEILALSFISYYVLRQSTLPF